MYIVSPLLFTIRRVTLVLEARLQAHVGDLRGERIRNGAEKGRHRDAAAARRKHLRQHHPLVERRVCQQVAPGHAVEVDPVVSAGAHRRDTEAVRNGVGAARCHGDGVLRDGGRAGRGVGNVRRADGNEIEARVVTGAAVGGRRGGVGAYGVGVGSASQAIGKVGVGNVRVVACCRGRV